MRQSYTLFLATYLIMVLSIFILPFFSAPSYSIVQNTLSELGAQNTPNNWIINLIFMSLSVFTAINGIKVLKGFPFQIILLLLFTISLFITAVYLHAPINHKIPFNSNENEIHSIFSTTTGIMFCTFCVAISFIVKTKQQIVLSLIIGIIALILSYSMFVHSDYRGLYQRGIFISVFGWFLYVFKKYKFLKYSTI